MKRRSRRYKELKRVEEAPNFKEAITVLQSTSQTVKFDEGVDIAVHLNLLKKHTLRDVVVYPHSFGESPKVLVFAKDKRADEAREAGADYVGDDDLIAKIQGGWLDFKVAIATPDMMRSIAKIARILGTKGLMPNPKAQTVTENVADAVRQIKAGRRQIKADSEGIVHASFGKVSMSSDALSENAMALCAVIVKKKPSDLKGDYVKSVYVSTTMGRSVRLPRKIFI